MSYFKLLICVISAALALTVSPLRGQDAKSKASPGMTEGPASVQMGKVAKIEVPAGYSFIDAKTYQAFRKRAHEPVSGNEMGLLVSTNEDEDLTVVFEFSQDGYVKDDEKNKLDANKLLDSYRRGTAEANKQRKENGEPEIQVLGWEIPPKYNETTHNLEWAIRGSVGGQALLNYDTRLLGRKGVMTVTWIVEEPEKMAAALPKFQQLLSAYSFIPGETYAEYRSGDKVAKYGLTALVVGGAAVGAAKLGLLTGLLVFLKKGWKLIVVAIAAVGTAIKKFFARITGRRNETIPRA
jgi:uncharacterized membrane-anchored protein